MKATLADVAKRAGVSIATASRYINQKGQIAQATASRLQAVIDELNYRPQQAARVLATSRTNAIGFLTVSLASPYYSPVLQGIECITRKHHLDLLISSTQREQGPKKGYHRVLGPNNIDGLLVFADVLSNEELIFLYENRFPMVLMHQSPPPGVPIPMVTVENKKSAYQLVEHLIQVHGFRRIAFLQGEETQEDSRWREQGYREALAANAIPFDPDLVRSGGDDIGNIKSAVKEWLAAPESIDAIFAFDDEKAQTLIYFLNQAGKRVPEDIAVVGFDDLSFTKVPTGTLTTVRMPIAEVGETAANQLIKLIHGEPVEEKVLLPTEMVIRRTCGCAGPSFDFLNNNW